MTNVVIPAVTSADTAQPDTEAGDNGDINLEIPTGRLQVEAGHVHAM